jgi:hypothetical protein
MDEHLLKEGLKIIKFKYNLYFIKNEDLYVLLILYVDDMLITWKKTYVKKILKHFGMLSNNPTKLPMVEGIKLEINMGEQEKNCNPM